MYKSTEEMMAKLRCLNLVFKFKIHYSTDPIKVNYKGSAYKEEIPLKINSTNQIETINFEGFTPSDKKQKVECNLYYKDICVEDTTPFEFSMSNNDYVENVKLTNYKNIFFNGKLDLTFSQDYFKHNLLSGANLWKDKGYVNWNAQNFNKETIFCIGDSYTFGHGVDKQDAWPIQLGNKLQKNIYNFGTKGLGHDGCLFNVEYLIENVQGIDKIICLLPSPTRKLFLFEFLEMQGGITLSHLTKHKLPEEYDEHVNGILDKILDKEYMHEDWVKCCTEIIKSCENKNIDCFISTWDNDMFGNIPPKNRLPVFPDLDLFPQRAEDGEHPHRKHYEFFVENIAPYLDKKQK